MFKLKTPLIIAGATCLLSMLIGLISGVQFITILERGLITGISCGGFIFLARIALERFIPDLFTSQSASDTVDSADAVSGTNVNITLDDDTELPMEGKGAAAEQNTAAGSNAGQTESGSTASFSATNAEQNDTASGAAGTDAPAPAESGFLADDKISLADNGQDSSELSDFPDMGSFMEQDEDIDTELPSGTGGAPTGFSMEGVQTDGADSKVMARAIRTVLATED